MVSIDKLVISLRADTKDFQTDMQRVGQISKRKLTKRLGYSKLTNFLQSVLRKGREN